MVRASGSAVAAERRERRRLASCSRDSGPTRERGRRQWLRQPTMSAGERRRREKRGIACTGGRHRGQVRGPPMRAGSPHRTPQHGGIMSSTSTAVLSSTGEWLAHLRREASRFVEVAARSPLQVHVPSYPAFTVETLSAHIGRVLRAACGHSCRSGGEIPGIFRISGNGEARARRDGHRTRVPG
jgi:hypothetical protein